MEFKLKECIFVQPVKNLIERLSSCIVHSILKAKSVKERQILYNYKYKIER